jgi:hypothetical protein
MSPKKNMRLKSLIAALLVCFVPTWAAPVWADEPPRARAAERPNQRIEREVLIMRDGAMDDGDVLMAQAGPEAGRHRVEMFNTGELPNIPDIDGIVSAAMAEAFAGVPGMRSRQVVKNAPYSAEVISERIQTLSDGNQITKRNATAAFRDSIGRTRQEMRDAKGELRSVQISDAADGTRYILQPMRKTATRINVDKEFAKKMEAWKDKAEAKRKEGKTVIIERSGPGEEAVIRTIEVPGEGGKMEVRKEVKINVLGKDGPNERTIVQFGDGPGTIGHPPLPESFAGGPMVTSFGDMEWSAKATAKDLGTRDFDGVRAEGKSRSYTIPAGEIGNKNPITVTTETWYSPELQVTVYSKRSDPRVGDTIYRLANIKRNEQPIALFSVPADYTVKEVPRVRVETRIEK